VATLALSVAHVTVRPAIDEPPLVRGVAVIAVVAPRPMVNVVGSIVTLATVSDAPTAASGGASPPHASNTAQSVVRTQKTGATIAEVLILLPIMRAPRD
jgi:hypothetical protein